MSKGLTKSDLAWVLVKILGLYLAYLGVAALVSAVITSNALAESLRNIPERHRPSTTNLTTNVMVLNALLPLGVGVYLLVSGRIAHRCLMSIPIDSRAGTTADAVEEDLIPGINLRGAELEAFKAWLESNPDIQKRSKLDQVALFRDAQQSGDA